MRLRNELHQGSKANEVPMQNKHRKRTCKRKVSSNQHVWLYRYENLFLHLKSTRFEKNYRKNSLKGLSQINSSNSLRLNGINIRLPPTGYIGLILRSTAVAILQVGVPLRVLWRYSDATVIGATVHAVATDYSHGYLNGTTTCSSHRYFFKMRPAWPVRRNLDVYSVADFTLTLHINLLWKSKIHVPRGCLCPAWESFKRK